MTGDTMLNDAMTGTAERPRFSGRLIEYFLRRSLTAAAKAGPQAKAVIAALKCVRENGLVFREEVMQ
jgi:hypothetical protein